MDKSASPAHEAPSKPGLGRLLLLLASVVLVLLLLARLLFPGVLNLDRLVRFFRYMGLRDRDGFGRISFEAGAANAYASFSDGLLVGSESSLTLYDLEGEQLAFLQASLPSPVLRTGGELSLVYSPGSAYLAALGKGGTVLMDQSTEGTILDANLSSDGYAVWLSAESGYKTVATVCNPSLEPIYRFYSRTHYLNACAVSEKGSLLAVADLEEQDGVYRSMVTILRTDEALEDLGSDQSSKVELELGNQVIYELRFLDRDHLVALGQNELCFFSTQGELLNSVSLVGQQLIDYSFSDEGWMLLALNPGGGEFRVLSYNARGQELGSLSLTDRVRGVSAAGAWAAVLTDQHLQSLDRRLQGDEQAWDASGAVQVCARDDGTALLIGSGGTRLYIP